MHGLRHSILKRWHSLTMTPAKAAATWRRPYWRDQGDFRDIACRDCRKFDAARQACSVPFGTPLRKCVVAAIEAHFSDVADEEVLEIVIGWFTLARNLVRRSGGRWTGIDPAQPRERPATLGHGGYGTVTQIPFADETFDRVFGIQTFEHWGQRAVAGRVPSDYADCMAEILRVLKPGGRLPGIRAGCQAGRSARQRCNPARSCSTRRTPASARCWSRGVWWRAWPRTAGTRRKKRAGPAPSAA